MDEKKEKEVEKITSNLLDKDETQDPLNLPSEIKKDEGEGKEDKPAENKEVETKPDPQPEIDYKTKFRKSASEANRLLSVSKMQDKIIKSFTSEDQVSDEEMKTLYPDFEDMSDAEKNKWKRFEMGQKRDNRISYEQQKIQIQVAKESAIQVLIDENEILAKHEKDFREFMSKPENELVDSVTLAKSFLFDFKDEDPKVPSEEIKKPEPTLEKGSNSKGVKPEDPNQEKKPETMTDDELADLMLSDPKKYLDYVQREAKMSNRK